jgi:hypothetical protein
MTISTTADSSRNAPAFPWTTGGAVTAVLLLPFLFRRRRNVWLVVMLCAGAVALGLTACGSSPRPVVPGTPAGTSTITVTATSGSGTSALSHTTTVTLTVQ